MNAAIKTRIGPRLYETAVLAVLLGVTAAWSQDQAAEQPAEAQEQPETATTGAEAENAAEKEAGTAADGAAAEGAEKAPGDEEKSILDDQTYEGEDEDFIPTEEIPVDKPIPFPTDI